MTTPAAEAGAPAHVMNDGMQRRGLPLLARLTPRLLLADLGYVDQVALRRCISQVQVGGLARGSTDALYEVLTLELALRAMFHLGR